MNVPPIRRLCGVMLSVFCLLGTPAPTAALPLLNEVLYDGPGADADDVFTELLGNPGEVLDGWRLIGVNGGNGGIYRVVDLTGAVIPADGLLLVATASARGALLDARDFVANVDWQNGPDAVQLLDPAGRVMDALQYGDAGPRNAGEGRPAIDVGAGFSLARDALATDSGDNARDFQALSLPTPGVRPAVPAAGVPEPVTLGMLAGGLLIAGLSRQYRGPRVTGVVIPSTPGPSCPASSSPSRGCAACG